jgi:hypothetical protein
VAKKSQVDKEQVLGFIGVGLDNEDGHRRLTRNENFVLVGGSAQTHEAMQEITIRFNEALLKRGKRLQDTPVAEVIELFHRARER